jgi:hypothetical protein
MSRHNLTATVDAMNMRALRERGREHGRELAERISLRVTSKGSEATEASLLFSQDLTSLCADLEKRGLSQDQIAEWVAGMAEGYGESTSDSAL